MPPLLSYYFSVFLIPRIEICREPAISIHIWFNSSHGELTLECDRDSRGVSREETERNSENGRDMLEIDVKKGNVDEHECYAEKNWRCMNWGIFGYDGEWIKIMAWGMIAHEISILYPFLLDCKSGRWHFRLIKYAGICYHQLRGIFFPPHDSILFPTRTQGKFDFSGAFGRWSVVKWLLWVKDRGQKIERREMVRILIGLDPALTVEPPHTIYSHRYANHFLWVTPPSCLETLEERKFLQCHISPPKLAAKTQICTQDTSESLPMWCIGKLSKSCLSCTITAWTIFRAIWAASKVRIL